MTARHSRLWADEPFVCLADLPSQYPQWAIAGPSRHPKVLQLAFCAATPPLGN
jgi:hypothetical protein